MGSPIRPRSPRKEQGAASRRTKKWSHRNRPRSSPRSRSTSRPDRGLASSVIDAVKVNKSYGDNLLMANMSFSTPARRDHRRHRAQRRGQDDTVPHDHRRRETRQRRTEGRPERQACVCRAEPRFARHGAIGLAGDQRRQGNDQARQHRDEQPGVSFRVSDSPEQTSRNPSARSRAANEIACTWRGC